MSNNLKTAGRRVKRSKIWAPGGKWLVYTKYFLSVQSQSEVIRYISFFSDF